MAIKIKKKSNREEEVESTEAEATATPDLATADAFEKASIETAAWVEENRGLVLGGFVGIIVLVVSAFFGLQYLESQRVEASSQLTPAFEAYSKPVEGSPELESFKKNWEGEMPETFESEEAKWQAVYDSASETLDSASDSALATPARMSKAGAALELGKYDEAVTLYEEVVGSTKDTGVLAGAYLGLAGARAAAGNFDGAIEAYGELAKIDDDLAKSIRYKQARLYERKGDVAKAKELYHAILDDDPNSPNKTDIERRLATL